MAKTQKQKPFTADRHREALARLEELEARSLLGGGEERIERQHQRGKLSARERLDLLLDPGSFEEIDAFVTTGFPGEKILGDGVVTGFGKVHGRPICVFAHDFTVFGGSLGERFGQKVCKVMDMAMKNGCPIVGLNDSGGARIQEGVVSLGAYADIFLRNTLASGVIPQISAIMGPCAGGAVYSPAITDFVFMVEDTSHMFVTGPAVIETVTHEKVSFEELGGAHVHAATSGVAQFTAPDEAACIADIKKLLSFLSQNNLEQPPFVPPEDDLESGADDPLAADGGLDPRAAALDHIVPADSGKPYDMTRVITGVVDESEFFEVSKEYAQNILTGFAHLGGHSIGVVAQQPMVLAGCLDIHSSLKAARFVRFCDAFNIPLLTFIDVPGFLPGVAQEHGGIIKHGAKLLYAYCEATVPKLSVITRKAYGGAYDVMSSKHIRGDFNVAWPTAEIAVMGAEGAVSILHASELVKAKDPAVRRAELEAEYRVNFCTPYEAAARGYVDAVIRPRDTRRRLLHALALVRNKRDTNAPRKHGNIPL